VFKFVSSVSAEWLPRRNDKSREDIFRAATDALISGGHQRFEHEQPRNGRTRTKSSRWLLRLVAPDALLFVLFVRARPVRAQNGLAL
jgi:hypothetical protein